ncbi:MULTISPECIES: hypothetical protein [unclassified Sphingobium]|uniref:hypothetical protein n=1 Tax=unclassified Sphingobium TaxID=2611147 RepID=UPI002224DB78|nr:MULTISPECIES: hypothetical protein [unclassified Sphingobium]MCW2393754.1 hypothetical protein [Sphingobium sp. B8D3B]MCW2417267.1 hypothetical protein [Sphingobium sp. B8D3C]
MRRTVILRGLALAAFTLHSAARAAEDHLAFVSCPIVRDTKTVPCWLAEHDGETYYLGIQTDVSAPFSPPSLGHKVLVEGEKTNEPRICGGIPLRNVIVSVMPERADYCQTLLMAEDRYTLPFESPRPPGPSRGRLAFSFPEPEKVVPPYKSRSFELRYDFDGTVGFRHPRFLVAVMDYARQVQARAIVIKGYRGRTILSDGDALTERKGLSELRAREAASLLQGAGLTSPNYVVSWDDEPKTGDAGERKTEITVEP